MKKRKRRKLSLEEGGEDGTGTGTPGKDKQPKMKRMVVRGKR
jgi:hypothetical protein